MGLTCAGLTGDLESYAESSVGVAASTSIVSRSCSADVLARSVTVEVGKVETIGFTNHAVPEVPGVCYRFWRSRLNFA